MWQISFMNQKTLTSVHLLKITFHELELINNDVTNISMNEKNLNYDNSTDKYFTVI